MEQQLLTVLLSFQRGARERDALLRRSLGRAGAERAVPGAVLWALQPHVLHGDSLGTAACPGDNGLAALGSARTGPKVEKAPSETCASGLLRCGDDGHPCCNQHPQVPALRTQRNCSQINHGNPHLLALSALWPPTVPHSTSCSARAALATVTVVASESSAPAESVPSHPLLPTGCGWGNSRDLKTFTKPPRSAPRCVFSARPTRQGTGQSFALYCTREHPFTNAAALCTWLFYNNEAPGPRSVLRSPLACTQPPFGHPGLGQACGWHRWCSRAGRRRSVAQGGDALARPGSTGLCAGPAAHGHAPVATTRLSEPTAMREAGCTAGRFTFQ